MLSSPAFAERVSILLVGNSDTFGRVDPVMSHNAANVNDLPRPRPDLPDPNFTETAGTRPWEPHPWGGVAGIVEQLADQAGLDLDVSMSARNAATLRGHFLNTANADWDLRGDPIDLLWIDYLHVSCSTAHRATHDGGTRLRQAAVADPASPVRRRRPPRVSAAGATGVVHASKHGSYLSALVHFGTITGIDPWSFGASEKAAADLGISPGDAVNLLRVASEQLAVAGVALTRTPSLHANPRAPGAGAGTPGATVCGGR